ncbi:MAG: DedA family protein [bacterium]|jgi:membrane protein DedA with SNARE-associated domain
MEFLAHLFQANVDIIERMGYPGIVFLMTLESSVFPIPSELVMPQAGYLVSMGTMSMPLVIILGVLGSWLGALLNYTVAMWLGRPFFQKYGKYFFCPQDKFAMVERFFQAHGEISTFTGRLIPVVRHLISIPAGLTRMKMSHFLLYTGIGSAIWVSILAYIGFLCGKNMDLIKKYSHICTIGVIIGCVVIIVVYTWLHKRRQAKYGKASAQP